MKPDLDPATVAALLGRPESPLTWPEGAFRGQKVLVTGAAGSIGSALVATLLKEGAKEVRALDRDEAGLEELERRLGTKNSALRPLLEDAGDLRALRRAVSGTDLVIHAAAYKQVPFAERFPRRVILDNLGSALTVLDACLDESASRRSPGGPRFVQISTDKVHGKDAVMGATKRVAEGMVRWAARAEESHQARGSFVVARLANVLGSQGSVLGVFTRHLAAGQPLPLTGSGASRLFLGPQETVGLILHAAAGTDTDTVYAADPGPAITIEELGRRLAASSDREPLIFDRQPPRPGDQREERVFDENEEPEVQREGRRWHLPRALLPAIPLARVRAALPEIESGDDEQARASLQRLIREA